MTTDELTNRDKAASGGQSVRLTQQVEGLANSLVYLDEGKTVVTCQGMNIPSEARLQ